MKRILPGMVMALIFFPSLFWLLGYTGRKTEAGGKTDLDVKETASGRLVTLKLPSAPFPHKERNAGYSFEGETYPYDPHYCDSSVVVFIPTGFKPRRNTNLVFFFHGWYSSIEDSSRTFSLYKQFARSGANALLVIPETARDSPDSFGGKLEEPGGFRRLVRDLLSTLSGHNLLPRTRVGSVVLTGHSGGYRVISKILAQGGLAGNIDEVYLFDGLFGASDDYAAWITRSKGRFVCIYSADGDTSDNTAGLIASLRSRGVAVTSTVDSPSLDSRLMHARVVFLESPHDHYGVVADEDEFRRFLSSSLLIVRR